MDLRRRFAEKIPQGISPQFCALKILVSEQSMEPAQTPSYSAVCNVEPRRSVRALPLEPKQESPIECQSSDAASTRTALLFLNCGKPTPKGTKSTRAQATAKISGDRMDILKGHRGDNGDIAVRRRLAESVDCKTGNAWLPRRREPPFPRVRKASPGQAHRSES